MKKQIFVCISVILCFLLCACEETKPAETTTAKVATAVTPAETQTVITTTMSVKETPLSDFEYEENMNGGITITKYTGKDADVVIPATISNKKVTEIGKGAFAWNKIVVSIKMPDTVIIIGNRAFWECLSLTEVVLSRNLESIGFSAFKDCAHLSNISLPNALTQMHSSAFENCTSLKHIHIPKSLAIWDDCTFRNSGLETIDLEEGLEIIGDTAFAETNIKSIILPQSIKTIERQAFANCLNLESITLNEGLITVEALSFSGAIKLTEIVIPKTVENITERAFSGCCALEKVLFEGNAPKVYIEEDSMFGGTFAAYNVHYTVYYHSNAEGFSSPEWNGYNAEIW